MKVWKCILLAVLLGPASELVIFAANIFHDEPWAPTPGWLMAIGSSLYYTVGQVDETIIEGIVSPVIFIRGGVSGSVFMALYVVMDTAIWAAMIYFGSRFFRKVRTRLGARLGHSRAAS